MTEVLAVVVTEEAPTSVVVTEEAQSVVVVTEEEPVVVAEAEQVVIQVAGEGGGPHTHPQSDIVGLAAALGAKAAQADLDTEISTRGTADATEVAARIAADTALDTRVAAIEADYATSDDLAAKAPLSHTHTQDEVIGLLTALSGKATAAQGALADTAVQPADLTAALDDLIGAAPGTLDTLAEIADFILANDDILDALVLTVAGKASQAALDAEIALARNADNLTSGTVADARIPSSIARDSEVTAAVAAEAALARDAANLTSGTIDDARIPSTITRDSELTTAISNSESGQVRDGDAAGGVLSGTYPNPGFAVDMATQAELDGHAHDLSALSRTTVIVSGTTYTVLDSDHGKRIQFTSATAVAVSIPNTLRADFVCEWEQVGAGQLTFAGSAGATARGRGGALKSAGQYAPGGVSRMDSDEFLVYGDIVT